MHVMTYLSRPTEGVAPGLNPTAHCGLWEITTCQCRPVLGNKCTALGNPADNRGLYVGAGAHWEISKTALKKIKSCKQ